MFSLKKPLFTAHHCQQWLTSVLASLSDLFLKLANNLRLPLLIPPNSRYYYLSASFNSLYFKLSNMNIIHLKFIISPSLRVCFPGHNRSHSKSILLLLRITPIQLIYIADESNVYLLNAIFNNLSNFLSLNP